LPLNIGHCPSLLRLSAASTVNGRLTPTGKCGSLHALFKRARTHTHTHTHVRARNTNRYVRDVIAPLTQMYCGHEGGCPVDLVGFSKSGWGVLSLLLNNPSAFRRGAEWDAPSMLSLDFCHWMTAPTGGKCNSSSSGCLWDMMSDIGTCDAWKRCAPHELVPIAPPELKVPNKPRIFLAGQHYFGDWPGNQYVAVPSRSRPSSHYAHESEQPCPIQWPWLPRCYMFVHAPQHIYFCSSHLHPLSVAPMLCQVPCVLWSCMPSLRDSLSRVLDHHHHCQVHQCCAMPLAIRGRVRPHKANFALVSTPVTHAHQCCVMPLAIRGHARLH
jgi:hypothetical protein